mgnify:CR=1 FL=1
MKLIDADRLKLELLHALRYVPTHIWYAVLRYINDAPAVEPPPNEPLTLEELRGMDGEPVWVTSAIGERPEWYIVDVDENRLVNPWDGITLDGWDDGYPYKAYRRKPEEGKK